MPFLLTPEELFTYYKFKQGKSHALVTKDIAKDLQRAEPYNKENEKPYKTGENSLFNVLIALCYYDPEIAYAQGMNTVVSWILKFTQRATAQINVENNRHELEFDECLAFFVFIHISEDLKYRHMYDHHMTKCQSHIQFLTQFIQGTFPEIYHRLIEECELVDLTPVFSRTVITMFI